LAADFFFAVVFFFAGFFLAVFFTTVFLTGAFFGLFFPSAAEVLPWRVISLAPSTAGSKIAGALRTRVDGICTQLRVSTLLPQRMTYASSMHRLIRRRHDFRGKKTTKLRSLRCEPMKLLTSERKLFVGRMLCALIAQKKSHSLTSEIRKLFFFLGVDTVPFLFSKGA